MSQGRHSLFPLLLALPLAAQVTVRQGDAADLKRSDFSSPMVIEVPLDKLKEPTAGGVYAFTDQDKFICDDASISLLVITKSIGWSKQVKLNLRASVRVRPSYDRKVTLLCTVLDGAGKSLAFTTLEISAKEKQTRYDSSTLELTQEAFDSLFQGDRHGSLKLVMTVVPDR